MRYRLYQRIPQTTVLRMSHGVTASFDLDFRMAWTVQNCSMMLVGSDRPLSPSGYSTLLASRVLLCRLRYNRFEKWSRSEIMNGPLWYCTLSSHISLQATFKKSKSTILEIVQLIDKAQETNIPVQPSYQFKPLGCL